MRTIEQLLKVQDSQRDTQWEDEFLTRLTESTVHVLSPDPQTGPDQWPYMMVAVGEKAAGDSADEPAQKVLSWLSDKGIGLAVNPMNEYPDFVLTYGMIWNFRETGRFIDRRPIPQDGEVEYQTQDLKIAGPPTPEYLPEYVRSILRQFWRDQGVLAPKILVLSVDGKNFDFAMSLESLGNPPKNEHPGIAEAISWFLPPHYSVVLVSEKGLPTFVGL